MIQQATATFRYSGVHSDFLKCSEQLGCIFFFSLASWLSGFLGGLCNEGVSAGSARGRKTGGKLGGGMMAAVSVCGIRGWESGSCVWGTVDKPEAGSGGVGFVWVGAPQPQAGGDRGSGGFSLPRRTCTPRRRTRS